MGLASLRSCPGRTWPRVETCQEAHNRRIHMCLSPKVSIDSLFMLILILALITASVADFWTVCCVCYSRFDRWVVLGRVRGRQFRPFPTDVLGAGEIQRIPESKNTPLPIPEQASSAHFRPICWGREWRISKKPLIEDYTFV